MKRLFGFYIIILSISITNGCSREDQPITIHPIQGGEGENPIPIVNDSTTAMYRQFFFKGTHNSYSGNMAGMKREGIKTQLESGLKFFEFDLFTFNTQIKLQKTMNEEVDEFSVFEYMGEAHLISYSSANQLIRIDNVSRDEPEKIYDNIGGSASEIGLKFSTFSFNANLYVFSYNPIKGDVDFYSFNGNTLTNVNSQNVGGSNVSLSIFVYNENIFMTIYEKDELTYTIRKVSFEDGIFTIGKSLYEINSLPINENLYPFQQNNRLYIFRHNVNNITNYLIESINTSGDTWTLENSKRETSVRLNGKVSIAQSNGNLYVNSYTAFGNVIGLQLVMDNNIPNLVFEYNNEDDMITGADVSIYPSKKGYYLFLQKGSVVQLASVEISELTLGHDGPGDEVDLSVDNPSSIFFKDWIKYLADWSNANPYHEPLFIMTELKEYEQWLCDEKWQNIIQLMRDNFGDKLRYHSSSGFYNESIVDATKIVDGKTLYFMDKNGSKEGGLLGKVILYIQPNNNITKSEYTNGFKPFTTQDGKLQENFLQLKRYREDNKFVSTDWRKPSSYGNDIGAYIDNKDDSYISRIFHMQDSRGVGQYDNIRCTDVMFAVSDKPYQGLYLDYVNQQKVKNILEVVPGCD